MEKFTIPSCLPLGDTSSFNSYIVFLRTELPTHESLGLILIMSKHHLSLITHSDDISKKLMPEKAVTAQLHFLSCKWEKNQVEPQV